MRVGFFFNHDQVHQVAHALPIAMSLLRHAAHVEVVIATTNDRLTGEVKRLCAVHGVRAEVVQLGLSRPLVRLAARRLDKLFPAAKLCVYGDNLPFFRGLDALVVTEKTSLVLKSRYGLNRLRIIHTRHGAGDRAIGFNRQSAGFDHVLVSGPKVRERLIREAGVPADRLSTVGYPKFDLLGEARRPLPFADPSLPTVLYNPHPSPHLSSWYKQGRQVLDHFVADRRYNLIFAPHVMLFHRRLVWTVDKLRVHRPGAIDPRVLDAPNIHVDLGTAASTDMTYTQAADLYLGDVSSQVYEFLHSPRPCLFLNSHGVAHRGDPNYLHWQAGEVLAGPAGLGAALDRAVAEHHRYRPVQRRLFGRAFDLTAEPSADRAARAILGVMAPRSPVPLRATRALPAPRLAA